MLAGSDAAAAGMGTTRLVSTADAAAAATATPATNAAPLGSGACCGARALLLHLVSDDAAAVVARMALEIALEIVSSADVLAL